METLGELIEELQKRMAKHGPDFPIRTLSSDGWADEVLFDTQWWHIRNIKEYIGPDLTPLSGEDWQAAHVDPKNWKTHDVLVIS